MRHVHWKSTSHLEGMRTSSKLQARRGMVTQPAGAMPCMWANLKNGAMLDS